MVYFLKNESDNTVKIGYSTQLDTRLQTLQTGNAGRLRVIYVIESATMAFEQFVHSVCKRYHITGEWFHADVIDKHLLQHPWYQEHMLPYETWKKQQEVAHAV